MATAGAAPLPHGASTVAAAAEDEAEEAEAYARWRAAKQASARNEAAWRAHYDPLQARTRPATAAPKSTNRARWNRKAQCWEQVESSPPADAAAVTSLSGFERLVLGPTDAWVSKESWER